MINVYDFDETIYRGDSTIDFYLFCLKRNPLVLKFFPIQLYALILYILGLKDKGYLKEKFYSFLKGIKNVDDYISAFWDKKQNKIKKWYLDQHKNSDVIISASPEFLLKPLEKKLKFKVIASKVNKNTGKLESKNCHDVEKVERFKQELPNKSIKNFYSDSVSDKPLMDISEHAYYVKRDKIYDLSEDKNLKIRKYLKIDKLLIDIGILYLVLPIIIQLYFWYNRLISIPCIIMLLIATYFVMKKVKSLELSEYKKIFNKRKIIFFLILISIICIASGAGGIFYQNWDYHGRNAIFRDLINHSWPVRYDYSALNYENNIFGSNAILNYYFAYWLPGALVGKIAGFKVAGLFMLLWQMIGVTVFFHYVCRFMKNIKYRYFWIFIAFGGLNVFGHIIVNLMGNTPISPIGTTHIDTSMGIFCMSTFITQLFWVFNQSIPAWIAVMLYLQEKNYKTCGYFFALLVPFGPFPMLGFLYLIFCHIIFGKDLNKKINLERIKELLTVPNFFGCLAVLPIVFMYTLNQSKKGMFFIDAYHDGNLIHVIIMYLLFVILEFLVYIIIINKKNYKQIIMCFTFFTIAPMFYIGGADLGNRSTIPLLIVMYLLVIDYLNKINKQNSKNYLIQKILIAVLLIASITNYNEFYRSIKYTVQNYRQHISNYADAYQTFDTFENKECALFITNFITKDNKENKLLQFILRNGK